MLSEAEVRGARDRYASFKADREAVGDTASSFYFGMHIMVDILSWVLGEDVIDDE